MFTLLICAYSFAGKTIDPKVKSLVNSNDEFTFDFYKQINEQKGNIVFSPLSISLATAMVYAGAEGNTEAEIMQLLHVNQPEKEYHSAYNQVLLALNSSFRNSGNALYVANSIWGQQGHPFQQSFLGVLKDEYRAPLRKVDYITAPNEALDAVNKWVAEKTKNKIPYLMTPGMIKQDTRLALANAIYLRGLWQSRFNSGNTRSTPFYVTPEKSVRVPMMYQQEDFRYMEDEQVQVVDLPYKGDKLGMAIILPKEGTALSEIEKVLTSETVNGWLGKLGTEDVKVYLPRFKIETTTPLIEALQGMGMKDAFDGKKADFSGMDGPNSLLFVAAAIHKAGIEVDEKRTTAYAATGYAVDAFGVPRQYVFNANRPFIFMIVERVTGTILFLGRLNNPVG